MLARVAAALFIASAIGACSLLTKLDDLTPSMLADAGNDATADTSVAADGGADTSLSDASSGADSAPFNANSFGGLELWLSGDVGVAVGDAGTITQWKDQATQAHVVDVPPSDPTCQTGPTVADGGINTVQAVNFDGYLQCLGVSKGFTDFTAGLTVFAVIEPGGCNSNFTGDSAALLDLNNGDQGVVMNEIALARNPAPVNTASGDGMLQIAENTTFGGIVALTGSGSWVPGKADMLEFRLPAAPSTSPVVGTAFVNGTAATIGQNDPIVPSTGPRNKNYLGVYNGGGGGGYRLFCGRLGELMLFSAALSDKDRQTIELYLKTKWSL